MSMRENGFVESIIIVAIGLLSFGTVGAVSFNSQEPVRVIKEYVKSDTRLEVEHTAQSGKFEMKLTVDIGEMNADEYFNILAELPNIFSEKAFKRIKSLEIVALSNSSEKRDDIPKYLYITVENLNKLTSMNAKSLEDKYTYTTNLSLR